MKKLLSAIALAATLISAANSHALTTVSGQITSNTTWTGEVLIQGPLFVRSGATLTVAAGTKVYGEKSSLAALIIDRGGKLNAIGTKDSPVVFTSDQPAGTQARADWGGIIINGYSTLNVTGGTKQGEGTTGTFGCTAGVDCNEADNRGSLQYVRVEYGGIQFTPDNELNGIAFQAVGSGTTVDHVQVHMSKDDCVEFFGGTVSLKYAIMSGCGDDSIDWTDGWRGNGQFLVVQQKGDEADRGIEADNWEFGHDNLPRSNPTLYNMTLVGDPSAGSTSNRGMTIRRGTAGNIRNSIILGFATNAGCDIDDTATFTQATLGNLIIDNNIFYNNLTSFANDSAAFLGTTMQNNKTLNPLLNLPYNQTAPDFRPNTESPALDSDTVPVAAPPTGNTYIVATDYIGAVDPDNDWTRAAWTSYGVASWTPKDNSTTTTIPVNSTTTTIPDNSTTTTIPVNSTTTTVSATTTTVLCPAQKILGEDTTLLENLRSFRDSNLANSAFGRKLAAFYYANVDRVNAILERSPGLRDFARMTLSAFARNVGSK